MESKQIDCFNPTVFPFIEIDAVSIPPRNSLISLAPIGIGTAEVESLSSYISRIARQYYVAPNKLLKVCVEKYFGSSTYLSEVGYSINSCKNINGLDKIAEASLSSIEFATGRNDLIYTTLLKWRHILSLNQMKTNRAWCPFCLQSDLENKSPIYERLLWKINIIESCPIHNQNLIDVCPHCKSSQSNFSRFCFPGFCSHCKTWMGESIKSPVTEKVAPFNIWTALEAGKILAASHKVKEDVRARIIFANSLMTLMNKTSYISYSSMRGKTGFSTQTIKKLTYGEEPVSFNILMKICSVFDCSPLDFLLGNAFSLTFREEKLKKK